MEKSTNITWHNSIVTKKDRYMRKGHKSCFLWFTELSGTGKSTLANAIDYQVYQQGFQSKVLDGDNIHQGLNKDLSFGKEDCQENIRRIGEVAKLFVDSGPIVSTAFISPFRKDRELVRKLFDDGEFIEVFVNCPIAVCENRDPKGLYKKARIGEIPEFTGISSPYEAPSNPEITIETNEMTIEESVYKILLFLVEKKIL
jgi:adenylylsulfate kinase